MRFLIAKLLDRLFPRACWGELGAWSFRRYGVKLRDAIKPSPKCEAGRTTYPGCWCGKFQCDEAAVQARQPATHAEHE